jgi:hypothetical protein
MNNRIIAYIFGICLLSIVLVSSASAQQRTFVSGGGNDVNPCSRTAPCRTIGQAIKGTSSGGEVVILDSAGYGAFTITQAVSITAPPGIYAGISVFGGDGIDVNAGSSDTVILRGLTVNNQGSSGSGIVFNTGIELHIEGCTIAGFSTSSGVVNNNTGNLFVSDSIVRGNGTGIAILEGGNVGIAGVVLQQNSTGASLQKQAHAEIKDAKFLCNEIAGLEVSDASTATVHDSVASNNPGIGFLANSGGAPAQLSLERCAASNNGTGVQAQSSDSQSVDVSVESCVFSGNTTHGVFATSTSTGVATVRVSNSTVTNNAIGLHNNGSPALLLSRGNNTVEANTTNTMGTIGSYSAK